MAAAAQIMTLDGCGAGAVGAGALPTMEAVACDAAPAMVPPEDKHHTSRPASPPVPSAAAPLHPQAIKGKMNALDQWASIRTSMVGKQAVVFLDYDGTLSPIVNEPDRAFMPDETRTVLRQVASRFPTAIITGRSREKVYSFVGLDDMIYAGSHGFDISGPLHRPISCQVADEYRPMLSQVMQELERVTSTIAGAQVEDNKFAVSMHYRNVSPELVPSVFEAVDQQLRSRPDLVMKHGKKVLELRPNVKWNKGSALLWILRNLGLTVNDVFPFYLGDDITDEDAFLALRKEQSGAGILIRDEIDDERRTNSTHASYVLRNPTEVRTFLERLVREDGLVSRGGICQPNSTSPPADTALDQADQAVPVADQAAPAPVAAADAGGSPEPLDHSPCSTDTSANSIPPALASAALPASDAALAAAVGSGPTAASTPIPPSHGSSTPPAPQPPQPQHEPQQQQQEHDAALGVAAQANELPPVADAPPAS